MEEEVSNFIENNMDRIKTAIKKSPRFAELKALNYKGLTIGLSFWGDIEVTYSTKDLKSVSKVLKALSKLGIERGESDMEESHDGRSRYWRMPELTLTAVLVEGVAGPNCELVQVGITEPKPIMEMRCGEELELAKAALENV